MVFRQKELFMNQTCKHNKPLSNIDIQQMLNEVVFQLLKGIRQGTATTSETKYIIEYKIHTKE